MGMRVIFSLSGFLFFLFLPQSGMSQDAAWEEYEIRQFDQEALDEYLQDSDYIYDKDIVAKESFWGRVKQMILEYFRKNFNGEITAGSKIINYLLAGIALTFIIYYLFSVKNVNLFRKKHVQNRKLDHTILNELEEEDLHAFLVQAEKERNLEMIVRLEYLLILKVMTAKKLVEWQSYKTNLDYYFELEDIEMKDLFTKVVDWFEYSWYGDFTLDEELMTRATLDFTKMKSRLEHS